MSDLAFDGIDLYRFPRVIPDDVEVIDAFPYNPLRDALKPARTDLLGELAMAHAPFSERRVACVLAGESQGYGGHVVERGLTDIDDPFEMALRRMPSPKTPLYGLMVTGSGSIKEKHVMPSGSTYDKIAPLLLPGSPIVVIPPGQQDVCRVIPEAMHREAYRPKARSVFRGQTFADCRFEAVQYTALCPEDCEFVANLRLSGIKEGIHYYLTGSANGQSGPSVALRPGMYDDLDIIGVSNRTQSETETAFEAVAAAWYGGLERTPKVARVAGSGVLLTGCVYTALCGVEIDFYAAPSLRQGLVRSENLERNYIHQLS